MFSVPANLGYAVLALLVGGESAGLPIPGETALIAGAALAAHGQLDIWAVIAIAAGAAIVGDNIGYLIGRRAGRRLLLARGPFARHRASVLEKGEDFFERYGAPTVFVGRWIAVLRICAALLAGANRMPWPRFLVWNALGGISWAASIGMAAYLVGGLSPTAGTGLGLVALFAVGLSVGAKLLTRRLRAGRRSPNARHTPGDSPA